jgi:pimeloyl-ACP methyl ester carboxylesterase
MPLPATSPVTPPAPARFAVRGCVRLAFRCAGPAHAPRVVLVPGFASHVDALWDPAGPGPFHARLAEHLRLVSYDRRGQGRSSRVAPPSVEQDAGDLAAVLDAAGIDRAIVVGQSQGGATALAFAAAAPERVAGLVLVGAYARSARADDYPHGLPRTQLLAFADIVAERWGDAALAALFAPSAAGDPAFARWWTRSSRMALTRPQAHASLVRRAGLDVRDRVAAVRAPTLVVHRTGDRVTPVEHGRWLAAHIPGARLLELEGEDHLWWLPDPAHVADPILHFALEHA